VGERAVLITYLNPAWKNAQQTQISFNVTNILFTTAIKTMGTNT